MIKRIPVFLLCLMILPACKESVKQFASRWFQEYPTQACSLQQIQKNESPCPASKTCDFLQGGTCITSCTTPGALSSDGKSICSPITRTMQPFCKIDSDCDFIDVKQGISKCNVVSSDGKGYCSIPCVEGQNDCGDGEICVSGSCHQGTCGDGIVQNNEVCDEGQLGKSCTIQSDCASGLLCCTANEPCETGISGGSGYCYYQKGKNPQGNGLNGHCSLDCNSLCAATVYNSNNNPFQSNSGPIKNSPVASIKNISDALTNGMVSITPTQACMDELKGGYWPKVGSNLNGANLKNPWLGDQASYTGYNQAACPCGYGLWVANTPAGSPFTDNSQLSSSITIYGGFSGTENSPADRRVNGERLGKTNWSGTVFSGGSFYIPGPSTQVAIIDGFQFVNGTGQAIGIAAGKGYLENIRISGIKANAAGAAIASLGELVLKHSFISLNENTNVNGQGGAVYIASTQPTTIEDTIFYGNRTSQVNNGGGGAIYNTNTGPLTIDASIFRENYTFGYGGAISNISAPLKITRTFFADNWASGGGGSIYNANLSSTVDNSCFVDNKAYSLGGGAIYDSSKRITITNSTFGRNEGLYPQSNSSMAEWGGDRPPSTGWNQINTISFGNAWNNNSFSTENIGNNLQYNNICPNRSYTPSSGQVCDGTDICGTRTTAGQFSDICINTNNYWWTQCKPPLYDNCANACRYGTESNATAGCGANAITTCSGNDSYCRVDKIGLKTSDSSAVPPGWCDDCILYEGCFPSCITDADCGEEYLGCDTVNQARYCQPCDPTAIPDPCSKNLKKKTCKVQQGSHAGSNKEIGICSE